MVSHGEVVFLVHRKEFHVTCGVRHYRLEFPELLPVSMPLEDRGIGPATGVVAIVGHRQVKLQQAIAINQGFSHDSSSNHLPALL